MNSTVDAFNTKNILLHLEDGGGTWLSEGTVCLYMGRGTQVEPGIIGLSVAGTNNTTRSSNKTQEYLALPWLMFLEVQRKIGPKQNILCRGEDMKVS